MNTYINGFRISKKVDNSEVVIHFTQSGPVFSFEDKTATVADEINVVGSFVMNTACANDLVQKLASLLSANNPPESESEGQKEE